MIRSIWEVLSILYSYVITIPTRRKYRVGNKTYSKRESREHIYRMLQKVARSMARAAGMKVTVIGRENLPKQGPVVYMANHRGLFDTVTLVSVVDDPCIAVVKKEAAHMPLIGKFIDALGCIYIDREDMRQSLEAILEGIKELKEGQSIFIFPEGTRAKGEEMGKFKEGSFKLPLKAAVPIVPIAFVNTEKVFEEKKRIVSQTVYMSIGKPIDTNQLSKEEKKNLPSTVQGIIEEMIRDIKEQ